MIYLSLIPLTSSRFAPTRNEEWAEQRTWIRIVTDDYRFLSFSITDPRHVTGKVTLSCKRFYQAPPTLPALTMAGNFRLEKLSTGFPTIAKIIPRLHRSAISWNIWWDPALRVNSIPWNVTYAEVSWIRELSSWISTSSNRIAPIFDRNFSKNRFRLIRTVTEGT